MTTDSRPDLSHCRLVAFAGASLGAAIVLAVAWLLFVRDVEPALGVLALPALVGPILHPRPASGIFSRYMVVGMIASTSAILLGVLTGGF